MGGPSHSSVALADLVPGHLQHKDKRPFRESLVVAMNPDARPERVVEPKLVAVRSVDPAAEPKTEWAGPRRSAVGATIEPQRIGACLADIGHPHQLEEQPRPHQPPVSRPLPAVRLSRVKHPPVIFKAPRCRTGIAHDAKDVIEFEHDRERQ